MGLHVLVSYSFSSFIYICVYSEVTCSDVLHFFFIYLVCYDALTRVFFALMNLFFFFFFKKRRNTPTDIEQSIITSIYNLLNRD